MSKYKISNVGDFFEFIFCVNVLSYTTKGFKPSYPRIVFRVILLSLFVLNFYFGTQVLLPRRDSFTMKLFSLWLMVSLQLLSPVLTLTVDILSWKHSAFGADFVIKLHKLAYSLGYQRSFCLIEKHSKKSQIFIVMFCLMIFVYLIFLVYPYNATSLKFIQIPLQCTVCILFDVIALIHQTNFLRTIQLYSIFLKKSIKSYQFWSLDKPAKINKLGTVRAIQSLLSKTNSKYDVTLLFTSIKAILVVAAIVSDFLVDKVFLPFLLYESGEGRAIEVSSYVDLSWAVYYTIFLMYSCHVHGKVTVEVSDNSVCQ